jgi:hypothetical protein
MCDMAILRPCRRVNSDITGEIGYNIDVSEDGRIKV